MKTYSGSRRVTSALNGGEWLTSCLGLFIAGKELRYTLDSPRAGLYVVEKGGKCLPSSGFEPWTIHTVACLLYRLSYSFVEFLRPCVVYVRTYVIHTHTHRRKARRPRCSMRPDRRTARYDEVNNRFSQFFERAQNKKRRVTWVGGAVRLRVSCRKVFLGFLLN